LLNFFSCVLRFLGFIRSQDLIANGALVIARLQLATGIRPVGPEGHNAGPMDRIPEPDGCGGVMAKGHRRSCFQPHFFKLSCNEIVLLFNSIEHHLARQSGPGPAAVAAHDLRAAVACHWFIILSLNCCKAISA
jgi:hypothetical protein